MPVQPKLQRPAAPRTPALTPLGDHAGKPPILLDRPITLVGSRHDARLHLLSRTVSKAHALIVVSSSGVYIRDLASRAHVYVNGKAVREVMLDNGDLIKIGNFTFKFTTGGEPSKRPASPTKAQGAHLEVDGADLPVPIADRVVLIGRRPTCDVALVESSVSTAHAAIVEIDGTRILRDLGSRTGTFHNGKRVRQIDLNFGDQIRIGETEMRYTPADVSVPAGMQDALVADDQDQAMADLDMFVADAEPPGPLDELEPAETTAVDEQPVNPPDSTDIDVEAQQLLVDGNLRQEKLSSSATYTELQAEADKAIRSASEGLQQQEAADVLAVDGHDESRIADDDDAASGTASREEAEVEVEADADDEFGPRRGWRRKRAPEPAEAVAEAAEPAQAPPDAPQPAAADQAAPAPVAEVESKDVAEDEVFRIPNDDEVNEQSGGGAGTAVLDDADASSPDAEAALSPFGDSLMSHSRDDADRAGVATDDEAHRPAMDLGLSPRLAEEAMARRDSTEQAEAPTPNAELESVDFSNLRFDVDAPAPEAPDAIDEAPLLNASEEDQGEAAATMERPLIDLGTPAEERDATGEQSPAAEPAHPLIAPDAIPPAAPDAEAPDVIDPMSKRPNRRPSRRKKKVDSTVIDTPPPAPLPPRMPEPVQTVEAAPIVDEAPPVPEIDMLALDEEPHAASSGGEGAGPVEVLDRTEPTPESALDLAGQQFDAELADLPAMSDVSTGESELTDTTFGRDVESFTGESTTGPIVEVDAVSEAEPELDLSLRADTEPTEDHSTEALAEHALGEEAFRSPEPPDLEISSFDAPHEDIEPLAIEEITGPASMDETSAAAVAPLPPPADLAGRPATPPVPSSSPPPNFGADQAGFLGGAPLKLGSLTPPPRPVRRPAAPFGRKPVSPINDSSMDDIEHRKFKRGPFDATPDDVMATDADAQNTIPPYSGNSATEGQVTTGFDGLAMPPVRQTDVFSQMFPSADDDAILHREAVDLIVPESNGGARAGRPSPSSALDVPPEDFWGDAVDVEAAAAPASAHATARAGDVTEEPALSQRPARRTPPRGIPPVPPAPAVDAPARGKKKRWWTIRTLLALMLISMAVAAAGIFYFVPIRTVLAGTLTFNGMDNLSVSERNTLEQGQRALLAEPKLRDLAQNLIERNHPGLPAGFLADSRAFAETVASAHWPDSRNELVILHEGVDANPANDKKRLATLLSAIYSANQTDLTDVRNRLSDDVQQNEKAIADTQRRIAALREEIEKNKPIFENRPGPQKLAELAEVMEQRETEWTTAVASATRLRTVLEEMQPQATDAAATTQPVGDAAEGDAQLAALQKSLDEAAASLAEQKKTDSEQAQTARKELDAALEQFQKQIATAQGTLENNPELQAYLDEAQSLQAAMKQLTTELIDRQQEQHQQLMDLKQKLDEKMQARRDDVWKNDPQLREFGERLAMTTRQHNAAVANGLTDEAESLQAEKALLEQMVTARQELIGEDTFYADTIKQLEEMIATTQKKLEDDRKSSEEMMARLQRSFAQNQASKLPAEQQALAADLEKRIAELNDARAKYNEAVRESTGGVDSRQLESVVADLRSKIEIRQAEIEQQSAQARSDTQQTARASDIEAKRAELAEAEAAAAAAQAAFSESRRQHDDVQQAIATARAAGDKLDEAMRNLVTMEELLQTQQRQLESKNRQLAKAVAPTSPTVNSVREVESRDNRATIVVISWGAIIAVFALMMFLASVVPAEPPLAAYASQPPPEAGAEAADEHDLASNGHANGDSVAHSPKRNAHEALTSI